LRQRHEHDNPYDPQAVSVNVNGRKVGYLPRNWAAKFDVALASNGYAQAACKAVIVGGWKRRGNDRGHFGIKLDIALPFNFETERPEDGLASRPRDIRRSPRETLRL
jgi:hypothetical protein